MDFGEWLQRELESRGWRQRELARRSGVSSAQISQVINGKRAGYKFCTRVAVALELPAAEVFRRAGLLAGRGPVIEEMRELSDDLAAFSPEDRQRTLEAMRALVLAVQTAQQSHLEPFPGQPERPAEPEEVVQPSDS